MKRIELKGSEVPCLNCVHERLAEELSFPEWYGRNLDALYDCLTDLREETVLALSETDKLEENLGPAYKKLLRVLGDAAEDNTALRLEIE